MFSAVSGTRIEILYSTTLGVVNMSSEVQIYNRSREPLKGGIEIDITGAKTLRDGESSLHSKKKFDFVLWGSDLCFLCTVDPS